jgi:hypothetical protein
LDRGGVLKKSFLKLPKSPTKRRKCFRKILVIPIIYFPLPSNKNSKNPQGEFREQITLKNKLKTTSKDKEIK